MSDPQYLIWSVNWGAWWRAKRAGYTTCEAEAGRYAKDEAERICKEPHHRAGFAARGPSESMKLAPECEPAAAD